MCNLRMHGRVASLFSPLAMRRFHLAPLCLRALLQRLQHPRPPANFLRALRLNPERRSARRRGPGRRQRQRGDHALGGQRGSRAAGQQRAAAGLGGRHWLRHLRVLLAGRRVLHWAVSPVSMPNILLFQCAVGSQLSGKRPQHSKLYFSTLHALQCRSEHPALPVHAATLTSAAPAITHAAPCVACLSGQLLRSCALVRRSGRGVGRPQHCDACGSLHRMHGRHAQALTHRDPYPSGFGGRSGEVGEDVAPPSMTHALRFLAPY